MWLEMLEDFDLDEGDGPDLAASFFVGDAGGRAARKDAKADHSCSDRYGFSTFWLDNLILGTAGTLPQIFISTSRHQKSSSSMRILYHSSEHSSPLLT